MSEATSNKLMTAQEVADYLSVSLPSVYLWCKRRLLPHVCLSVGPRKECVRFKKSAIDGWLEEHSREATGFSKWDRR